MRPAVHRKSHPASQAPGWLFAFRELWSSETNNWNEDSRYAADRMDWPFVVARFPINNAAIYWFACAPSSTGVCWLALWHRTIQQQPLAALRRQWLERRCFRGVDGGILRSLLRQGTRTRRRPPVERRLFVSSRATRRAWKRSSRCAIRIRLAEKLKDRRRCA